MKDRMVERFLRYVKIPTYSREDAPRRPSSPGQLELARLLVCELKELGAARVRMSEDGYVYADIPASGPEYAKRPVIGFIAHLDTSAAVGTDPVTPIVHREYDGGVLHLSAGLDLDPAVEPLLKRYVGSDIISSDGRTILGADDKAGVAIIMTFIERVLATPDHPHGPLRIAFSPDEEIGDGCEGFDIPGWGAKFAYTVDGEQEGELSDETFCAASAQVSFAGKNVHPGFAKDIMVNSLYAAADFLQRLPDDEKPETTAGYDGYFHPYEIQGHEEKTVVKVLLRDFQPAGLADRKTRLQYMAAATQELFPKTLIKCDMQDSYRNMKEVLQSCPFVSDYAEEAMRQVGVKPLRQAVRGGTDGARLTFRGLPCPNIFTGAQNVHGRTEWISAAAMEKSVDTLMALVRIWAERGEPAPAAD